MANTLYITEYGSLAPSQAGVGSFIMVPLDPPVAEQTVAIGGVSAQSAAFNAATRFIRLHTDSICSVEVGGTNPTAAATNGRLAANQTEYRGVTAGDKLAVISNT